MMSILFFYSYTLIVGTIFVRLFIAIILQTFKTTTERENKFMNGDLSEKFRNTWAMFDPDVSINLIILIGNKFYKYPLL